MKELFWKETVIQLTCISFYIKIIIIVIIPAIIMGSIILVAIN